MSSNVRRPAVSCATGVGVTVTVGVAVGPLVGVTVGVAVPAGVAVTVGVGPRRTCSCGRLSHSKSPVVLSYVRISSSAADVIVRPR